MSEVLETFRSFLEQLGLAIPYGDMPVFLNNMFVSGVSVWVDAALFFAASLLMVAPDKRWQVVLLIVVAHALYGFLGLLLLSLEKSYLDWSQGIVIAFTSYFGLRFITEGLDGDEEGSPEDDAHAINLAIIGVTALSVYSGVSIDELFMVLQRSQWMVAQGWDTAVQAANIAGSMVVLFALLGAVKWALEKELPMSWLQKHGDHLMFCVFGLMMYYIVRAIAQNGFGFIPREIPYTGIAWELMILGFVLTWLLRLILRNQTANRLLNKSFLLTK